jgi:hypothetical protein
VNTLTRIFASMNRWRVAIGCLVAITFTLGNPITEAAASSQVLTTKRATQTAAKRSGTTAKRKPAAQQTSTTKPIPNTTVAGQQHSGQHLPADQQSTAGSLISTEVITAEMGTPAASVTARAGRFAVVCPLSHRAANDPVIYPGKPGASHMHDFFGNRTTNADSNGATLVGKSSTCQNPGETAAYWAPAASDASGNLEPFEMVAYYSNGTLAPASIEPFPTGLEMIAGNPAATTAQNSLVAGWSCDSQSILEPAKRTALPPLCPAGRELTAAVTFPQCWDGRNLRSLPGQAHVARPTNGVCPATHPGPIPELTMTIRYRQPNGVVTLASGSPLTLHADVITAWVPGVLDARITSCIKAALNCE